MYYPQHQMKMNGHFHTLSTLIAETGPVVLTA